MYTDCFTTYWKQHASDPVNFKFPMDVLQPGWITCHPKILVSTSTCGKVSLVLTALGSFFGGVACPIGIFLSVKAGAHGPRLRSGASRVVLSDRPQKMWNSCGGIIPYRINVVFGYKPAFYWESSNKSSEPDIFAQVDPARKAWKRFRKHMEAPHTHTFLTTSSTSMSVVPPLLFRMCFRIHWHINLNQFHQKASAVSPPTERDHPNLQVPILWRSIPVTMLDVRDDSTYLVTIYIYIYVFVGGGCLIRRGDGIV